jgi:signal transduction histidine kinase
MNPTRFISSGAGLLLALVLQTPAQAITLTPGEQAWIAAHPLIRVGLSTANAPFSVGGGASITGIASSMLQRISVETGLRFNRERTVNWDNAALRLKEREIDLVVGADGIMERSGVVLTQPFVSFPAVLIGREDAPFLIFPLTTGNRSIALPRSFPVAAWKELLPSSPPHLVDSTNSALLELEQKHVDLVVSDLATASYAIKNGNLRDLKLVGVLDFRCDERIAVRSDWPELVSILNKVLSSIPDADKQEWSRPWISSPRMSSKHWGTLISFSLLGVTVACVVGWFIFRYRRRLERLLIERKRLQSELISTNQRATNLHGEKTEVLRLALQHFDRPLSDVAAISDRLSQIPLSDAEVQTSAVEITSQVARMRQSLDVLREMQALAENNRRLQITAVNVGAVVKEALSNVESGAAKRNIRLSAPAPTKTWFVNADVDTLRKVVESLLTSGIKASSPGSAVSIALWQAEERVLLTISDEGPGLAMSDQAELFRRPGQTSSPLEGNERSANYGLGLVHNLVMAMEGWLWCESELGRGTTFVIELSLAQKRTFEQKPVRTDVNKGARSRKLLVS